MQYTLTNRPAEKDINEIFSKLLEYNLSRIELKKVEPLAIFIDDETGNKLAGLSADTHGNWLEISYLWVDERLRGCGTGSKLLQDAETEAVNRGCQFSFVNTFGFQARDFYLKLGYKEVFTLEQYPVTGKRHYFVKQLTDNL